jgi:hypothetical protein
MNLFDLNKFQLQMSEGTDTAQNINYLLKIGTGNYYTSLVACGMKKVLVLIHL